MTVQHNICPRIDAEPSFKPMHSKVEASLFVLHLVHEYQWYHIVTLFSHNIYFSLSLSSMSCSHLLLRLVVLLVVY